MPNNDSLIQRLNEDPEFMARLAKVMIPKLPLPNISVIGELVDEEVEDNA